MAGYIIGLDSKQALEGCIRNGIYSTKLKIPSGFKWGRQHEGTFSDYATMKPGDNIYFFVKRKIYGIGELVNVGEDCKFKNYIDANKTEAHAYSRKRSELLLDLGRESVKMRWICTFKPEPNFFKQGVDMDEVLASNPSKFRMLRAFWKLSFVKIDEDENNALKDIMIKTNENSLSNPQREDIFDTDYQNFHNRLMAKINHDYRLDLKELLSTCADGNKILHEMAIEASLLFGLANHDMVVESIFGSMDYISHQVIASPFKPIDYMDKMDVFAYSLIPQYSTKSKFLIAELKKDKAKKDDVDQLMKYVDWVKEEYSYGDYGMIKAFLIAYEFPQGVVQHAQKIGIRKYIIGRRPAQSKEWNNLKLIKYSYNSVDDKIEFSVCEG